ncbi:hypothetical protein ACTXT7_011803 [Hymenolepis weldensis]
MEEASDEVLGTCVHSCGDLEIYPPALRFNSAVMLQFVLPITLNGGRKNARLRNHRSVHKE